MCHWKKNKTLLWWQCWLMRTGSQHYLVRDLNPAEGKCSQTVYFFLLVCCVMELSKIDSNGVSDEKKTHCFPTTALVLQCPRLVLASRPGWSPLFEVLGLVLVSDWMDSGFLINCRCFMSFLFVKSVIPCLLSSLFLVHFLFSFMKQSYFFGKWFVVVCKTAKCSRKLLRHLALKTRCCSISNPWI